LSRTENQGLNSLEQKGGGEAQTTTKNINNPKITEQLTDTVSLPPGLNQSEFRVTTDEKDTALYYYLYKVTI